VPQLEQSSHPDRLPTTRTIALQFRAIKLYFPAIFVGLFVGWSVAGCPRSIVAGHLAGRGCGTFWFYCPGIHLPLPGSLPNTLTVIVKKLEAIRENSYHHFQNLLCAPKNSMCIKTARYEVVIPAKC